LPEAEVLIRELNDFRVQYTPVGNIAFNARAGRHDDLVLALSIAIWRAEGGGMPGFGLFDLMRQRYGASAGISMFIGVDLGQQRDATAVAIVRRVVDPPPRDLAERPAAVAVRAPVQYAKGSLEYAMQRGKP